jgi:hypothetical protein
MSLQTAFSSPQIRTERPPAERRQAVRHPYRQAVSCFVLPNYERFWAWAQNISVSGIGIIANRQLKPGTLLVMQLKNLPLPLITLAARVVHCTAYPNSNWWLGCEFDHHLSEETLSALLQAGSLLRIGSLC